MSKKANGKKCDSDSDCTSDACGYKGHWYATSGEKKWSKNTHADKAQKYCCASGQTFRAGLNKYCANERAEGHACYTDDQCKGNLKCWDQYRHGHCDEKERSTYSCSCYTIYAKSCPGFDCDIEGQICPTHRLDGTPTPGSNGIEYICQDKKWERRYADRCDGFECDIEGQICKRGSPGATGQHFYDYECNGGTWQIKS